MPPRRKKAAKNIRSQKQTVKRSGRVSRAPAKKSAASDAWNSFTKRLVSALNRLPDEHYLILNVVAGYRYVQFAKEADGYIRAECVSNNFLPPDRPLSAADERALALLGWHSPTRASDSEADEGEIPQDPPNWYRDFKTPLRGPSLGRLVVRTFTEVIGVPDPERLQYSAFDQGGGTPFTLPELGIERESHEEHADTDSPEESLADKVLEASAGLADDGIVPLGPNRFGVEVDGIPLNVIVDEERNIAHFVSPLFISDAFDGDVMRAVNEMNAEHLAFGYTYVRDGEVRYAADVLLLPFQHEVVWFALKFAAAVVRGLRGLGEDESGPWTLVGKGTGA